MAELALSHAIGQHMRSLREQHGVSADALARAARDVGLSWERSTVSRIEGGQRSLSAEELFALPLVLDTAGLGVYGVADLLPSGKQMVALSKECRIGAEVLPGLLDGTFPQAPARLVDTLAERRLKLHAAAATGATEKAISKWWPERARREAAQPTGNGFLGKTKGERTAGDTQRIIAASAAEAEHVAGRRLDLSSLEVATIAFRLWGESLTEHRDHLVAEQVDDDADPRTVQALRGRYTRKLLDELRQAVVEFAPKRRNLQ